MAVHLLVVRRAAVLVERTELVSLVKDFAQLAPHGRDLSDSDVLRLFREHRRKFKLPLAPAPTRIDLDDDERCKSPAPTASRAQTVVRSPENVTHQPRRR